MERVIPTTAIRIEVPSLVPGQGFPFDLLGLAEEDLDYVLKRFGATVTGGNRLEPGTNGLMLTHDVARMLGVGLGAEYEATNTEFYPEMEGPLEPTTFEVVGLLQSDVEFGLVSGEFLNTQVQYRAFPVRLLVAARKGGQTAVDEFLRSEVHSIQADVVTLEMVNERIVSEALPGLVVLLPVVIVVATAFSLVIVVVNHIANARRMPEFGILLATGHSKRWLVRRLTSETATLAAVGWVLGTGISILALYLLKRTYFASRGYDLAYVAWLPVVCALPIPAVVAGFTFASVRRTLERLDPVAIVERRELSQEDDAVRTDVASTLFPKPLAPTTFYRRHRRRAALLVGVMGVMALAVVLVIFALAAEADAHMAFVGYLSRVTIVRSPGGAESLDPGVVARVADHPAVDRLIPVAPRAHMLSVRIPPFTGAEASPFAVHAEDMAYLVELCGLELREGRLPRSGRNEMVIPQSVAQNRHVAVGDVIGDASQPAHPGAESLPLEFVVSGIFAPPPSTEDGSGWGFVSLEFLEGSGSLPMPEVLPLIVVPKEGQKEVLDTWLENEVAGLDASVLTYRQQVSRIRDGARQNMAAVAVLEAVIVVVAAIGLAVLNYILASQRQSEYGVLRALGYNRLQLISRGVGEAAFATALAWLLTAAVAFAAMLLLRAAIYEPRGLTFRLVNVTPWLYTLPIPIATLAVTAATTTWTQWRLDPISIIERRE